MAIRSRFRITFALAIAAGTVLLSGARAEPVEAFYRGKTVTIIVGAGAGGGYAYHARILPPYLGRYIPGNPTVVLQFLRGGGGTKAANHLFNVAPRDGSVLAMLTTAVPVSQLTRGKAIRYDASRFRWLGKVSPNSGMLAVWHTAPATTLEGAKKTTVLIGATSKGGALYITPTLINSVLGTRFKVIKGYPSGGEINLAIEKGEVHGRAGSWQILKAQKADWLRGGKLVVLVQLGLHKAADLPEVPLLIDLVKTEEQRRIVEFWTSHYALGRSLTTPPGVPADRLAALRKALEATVRDPRLLAEAKRRNIEIEWTPGVALDAIVGKLVASPKSLIAKARAAVK